MNYIVYRTLSTYITLSNARKNDHFVIASLDGGGSKGSSAELAKNYKLAIKEFDIRPKAIKYLTFDVPKEEKPHVKDITKARYRD